MRAGSLFVAVPTVGGDATSGGYRHLIEARERGAVATVIQGGDAPEGMVTIRVGDARTALADLSAEFFGHPSRDLHLFGVTGTDGKTTTTYLTEQIFARSGFSTGLIGTVDIKVGQERRGNADRMTTPESLDLQRLLREMVDAGVSHVALEASSHALALDRLRGCRFTACALTNITADHIEFHGSWEQYFAAKVKLFTEVARGKPAVLNRDDDQFARLTALVSGPVVSYGRGEGAQLRAAEVSAEVDSSCCRITFGEDTVTARIPLPGPFNVSNGLAAIGLAVADGLSLDVAARGLSAARPPPGRLQRIATGRPFEVLVDYAHTVNAFRSVLEGVRAGQNNGNRLIAVFGAAGNRDRAKRPVLAAIARQYTDYFYVTNEDPFDEPPEAIIDEVLAGIDRGEQGVRFEREPDRARAIERALRRAGPGDTVIILGKGHEQSIVVGGRKEPWNDALTVRRVLEAIE